MFQFLASPELIMFVIKNWKLFSSHHQDVKFESDDQLSKCMIVDDCPLFSIIMDRIDANM